MYYGNDSPDIFSSLESDIYARTKYNYYYNFNHQDQGEGLAKQFFLAKITSYTMYCHVLLPTSCAYMEVIHSSFNSAIIYPTLLEYYTAICVLFHGLFSIFYHYQEHRGSMRC